MDRIVDISSEGLHLSVYRGFLKVSRDEAEIGRIPLDDIGAIITHAHGLIWSNNLIVKLSTKNIPVVICAANHVPVSCLWPIVGHHQQGARMQAQAGATKPLRKRLWRQVVQSKIDMQHAVLKSIGSQEVSLAQMALRVRSGDPENLEAQAARRYWPALMGPEFRRNSEGTGANALLNYGYTILRAIVSRAICGAGLHPSFSLHHSSRINAFALADDLMEPYRPLIDCAVRSMIKGGMCDLDTSAKTILSSIGTLDLMNEDGIGPLTTHIGRLLQSLVAIYEGSKAGLQLPSPPPPLVLAGIGRGADD